MKDRLALWGTRLIIGFFALVPFGLLYALSDALAFLMFRVFGYRGRVVEKNLRLSFPGKEEPERRRIAADFYRNLCDILLETLKGHTMSERQFRERMQIVNLHLLKAGLGSGRPLVLMGSHYANWEWISLVIKLHMPDFRVLGVYKSMKNPLLNAYFNRLRGRFGLELVAMEDAGRAMVRYRNTPTLFCLIADQTPSNTRAAHWLMFLHQETPFLPGGDKIARRLDLPVYYFHMERSARGHYRTTVSKLAEEAGTLPEGTVTRLFARKLEAILLEDPPNWLWSHRRWKHKRPEGTALLPEFPTAPS